LVINYFQTILLHYSGQKIIYNIRDEVFTHMQSLSVEFYNQNPVGRLVTRVTNDTETFGSQVEKAKNRFGCKEVTLVGDRGMINPTLTV